MSARRPKALFLLAVVAAPLASPVGAPLPQALGPAASPEDILRCERQIIYRGKRLPCDSPSARDGEGLRTLLLTSPEALAQLDRYQQNRRSLKSTAYVGMAGLLILALAPRFSNTSAERTAWMGGGLAITLGSFAFGRAKLNSNEDQLDQAIETYNQANPSDLIQLKRQ